MTTYDHAPTERINFGLVLNDLHESSFDSEVEFGGWRLKRAGPAELEIFREDVQRFARGAEGLLPIPQEALITETDKRTSFQTLRSPADFRYSVLEPTSDPMPGWQLAEALRVSEADLWVEYWHIKPNDGYQQPLPGGDFSACHQFFARTTSLPQKLEVASVELTVKHRRHLNDEQFSTLGRSLALFRGYDVVPEHSNAKLLGYFAVLESLLSHSPAKDDRAGTVTRQLTRNLLLINNQLPKSASLGFDGFGVDANKTQAVKADKVIKQLYGLRSAVAHGADPASYFKWFDDNRHRNWPPGPVQIGLRQFLRRVVQRVLQYGLMHPQLVSDLR